MSGAQFTIRRKVLVLAGASFHIYNARDELIGFCRQKAFRLKEDLRIYSDDSQTDERARIAARSILDFSAAYDVYGREGTRVGVRRRKGFTSLFRDSWEVLDADEHYVGRLQEDSAALALVRRFLTNLLPQSFHLEDPAGRVHAQFQTHFNPFIYRMTVTVEDSCPVSPEVVIAAGLLLAAIEGRQD